MSLAIAYAMKKRGRGGDYQSPCVEDCNDPTHPHNQESGYVSHEGNDVKRNGPAKSQDARALNQHGEDEQGPQGVWMAKGGMCMAEGGQMTKAPSKALPTGRPGAIPDPEPEKYDQTFENGWRNIKNEMGFGEDTKKPRQMAEGGFIGSHQPKNPGDDMVGRVMKKRQNMYSEGGKVSNDAKEFEYEFDEPNQFDDLVRRDDLEFEYTGKNSGDELGSKLGQEKDIVNRVMMKKRKQHNPVPA